MRELNAKIEEQSDRERIAPIGVSYWTDWERKGPRFDISIITSNDIIKKVTWKGLLERVSEYQKRMLLGFQECMRGRKRLTGEEHQYESKGVPVFDNSVALCLSMRAWDYLMSIMPE